MEHLSESPQVPVEIERKWDVGGFPEGLPVLFEHRMRQGYISTKPVVRIREEAGSDGKTEYILCVKSSGKLKRTEIEIRVTQNEFAELEAVIGAPLIEKLRRTYALPDGHRLEVSYVDADMPTAFYYAEIEFETEEEALSYVPPAEMAAFFSQEVTGQKGSSMASYWRRTRL